MLLHHIVLMFFAAVAVNRYLANLGSSKKKKDRKVDDDVSTHETKKDIHP